MASQLDITETRDGLRCTLTFSPSRPLARLFAALAIGMIASAVPVALLHHGTAAFVLLVGSCVFAWMSYAASSTRRVILRAGEIEFRCGSQSIARAGIDELVWQSGAQHVSEGLYAVGQGNQVCIFPDLPQEDVEEVLEAIYRRFPDMRGQDRFNPGAG